MFACGFAFEAVEFAERDVVAGRGVLIVLWSAVCPVAGAQVDFVFAEFFCDLVDGSVDAGEFFGLYGRVKKRELDVLVGDEVLEDDAGGAVKGRGRGGFRVFLFTVYGWAAFEKLPENFAQGFDHVLREG